MKQLFNIAIALFLIIVAAVVIKGQADNSVGRKETKLHPHINGKGGGIPTVSYSLPSECTTICVSRDDISKLVITKSVVIGDTLFIEIH